MFHMHSIVINAHLYSLIELAWDSTAFFSGAMWSCLWNSAFVKNFGVGGKQVMTQTEKASIKEEISSLLLNSFVGRTH